jgi:hypothetical protein
LTVITGCHHDDKGLKAKISGNDTATYERKIIYTEDSTSANVGQGPFLQNFARLLGLQPLSNKSEGVGVRIWIWNPDSNYVVTIINNGIENRCHILEFYGNEINKVQCILVRNEW